MLSRVALVRTDVSEEISAPFIRVTRIDELGTTLAVNSNRSTLQRNTNYLILVTLMMAAVRSFETSVVTRGGTSQKTAFFLVTAMKISNLT
jgi:hypothetical protein